MQPQATHSPVSHIVTSGLVRFYVLQKDLDIHMATVEKKPSALDALRGLVDKKPQVSTAVMVTKLSDPAIAGAKREKSGVVKLGMDPTFTGNAQLGTDLKRALEQAESQFKLVQVELRKYGAGKRDVYNETFKTNTTTVCIPFEVEVDGKKETKYVQVVCQNKYSVQSETLLNNRNDMGEWFDRLFTVDTEKKLKGDAGALLHKVLVEAGLDEETASAAMDQLFETTHTVKTKADYETDSKEVPEHVRTILGQTVARVSPSLRFPD